MRVHASVGAVALRLRRHCGGLGRVMGSHAPRPRRRQWASRTVTATVEVVEEEEVEVVEVARWRVRTCLPPLRLAH